MVSVQLELLESLMLREVLRTDADRFSSKLDQHSRNFVVIIVCLESCHLLLSQAKPTT